MSENQAVPVTTDPGFLIRPGGAAILVAGSMCRGRALVLLDANPVEDIRNTRRIRAVVANGRLFRRADLDRLLAEAADQEPEGEAQQ